MFTKPNNMKWISLDPCPVPCRTATITMCTPLILINNNELLVIPCSVFTESLYKYNIKENEWKKWIKYPNDIFVDKHTASINKYNKLLYILNRNGEIIEINLKTQKFNISCSLIIDYKIFSCSIIIDKQFHFFGQSRDYTSFYKWNENDKKIIKLKQFNRKLQENFNFASTFYISSIQSIIIIPVYGKQIYIYSLKKNECKHIIFDALLFIQLRTAVITKNDQFIIIIGGPQKCIGVLDVKCMKIRISNIQSPSNKQIRPWYVTIVNDDIMDEILVFGFIRISWNDTKFNNIQYLPTYLIKLIGKFYCLEIMYYVEFIKGLHWKINTDNILK